MRPLGTSIRLALCSLACLVAFFSAPLAPAQDEPPPPPLPVFEFHSGFWLNLHHTLYRIARSQRAGSSTANPAGSNTGIANLSAGELRVWFQLQRLPWQHGCGNVAACTEHRHRRPCPRRCPKALRKSGRPHVCIPANDPRICLPGCTGHAAMCPDRQGGGLVFREIKERRRKTVALPPELVAVLKAQREAQDLERETAANLWHDWTRASPWPWSRRCSAIPTYA